MAARLLGKVRGVKVLSLRDFRRLSGRVLEVEGLRGSFLLFALALALWGRCTNAGGGADLKHLTLATSFPDSPSTLVGLKIPFQLDSLRLPVAATPPHLISRLFLSSASTITDLDLSLLPSLPGYHGLVSSFPVIAGTLKRLRLAHQPSPTLTDHLKLCTSLQTLQICSGCSFPPILLSLHPGILQNLSLEFEWDVNDSLALLREVLERKEMKGVKRVEIRCLEVGSTLGARKGFEEWCRGRRVELRWVTGD